MTTFRVVRLFGYWFLCRRSSAACGSGSSEPRQVPVGPTAPSGTRRRLGYSHAVDAWRRSPLSNGEQMSTLRPTLTVQNATSSNQSGTRTYEFQVSDNAPTSRSALRSPRRFSSRSTRRASLREATDAPSFTVPQDLQPATRMYWRARVVQGTTTSDWTSAGNVQDEARRLQPARRVVRSADSFGETSEQCSGAHTWIPGKGAAAGHGDVLRAVSAGEPISSSGEFSVEVEGLRPDGPNHKLKIFSMNDRDGDIIDNSAIWE